MMKKKIKAVTRNTSCNYRDDGVSSKDFIK